MVSLEDHLRQMLLTAGADIVGFADLHRLPAEMRQGLPFGVSIGMGLDRQIVRGISAGPTLEYQSEYNRLNAALTALARQAADFLVSQGYRAVAGASTPSVAEGMDIQTLSMPLPHKTVATRAGLGWIGKTALLVTEKFGSALRLSSVLTDAPLTPGNPIDESRCGECDKCVQVCPAHAGTGKLWQAGLGRQEFFDAFACYSSIKQRMPVVGLTHTVCGMCIAACPHTAKYLAVEP